MSGERQLSCNSNSSSSITAALKADLLPTHPGELLGTDVLDELAIDIAELGHRLKISRELLERILVGEEPITAAIALKLAKLLKGSPQFWLSLQQKYDLAVAERLMINELAEVQPIEKTH